MLVEDVVELLALDLGDLELLGGGLAGAVAGGEGAGAPGGAAADLAHVGELAEAVLVAERHVHDAVVGEGAHGGDGGGLLAAAGGGGADEDAGELAVEAAGGPLATGLVPEGLPLRGEVAEAGRDAHQEAVVLLEGGGVRQDGDVGLLAGGVHLGEHVGGQGLGDLVQVAGAAGLLDTALLSLGQGTDVSVHGVLSRRHG